MSLLANKRIRIRPNICSLVKRSLKGPGRLLVQKNVEISPHDVLGHYKQTLGFTRINLAQELNISPNEIPKTLNKAVGQTIFKGELLASKKGLFNKHQIIAPTDGIFQSLDQQTGEVTLKFLPKDTTLTAGVFGVVQNVDYQKGEVIIKTMMSEIFGVYGTGDEKEGFINVISGAADLVNKDRINAEHRGQILVAGSLMLEAVIRKAISSGVSGLVCGGMNMDDYVAMTGGIHQSNRANTDVGIGIVGTEGFGIIPIADDIYDLLKAHNGQFSLIQGNIGRVLLPSIDPSSILSCRKVALPLDVIPEKPPLGVEEINIGSKVRLIASPFMGSQGEVVAIDGKATRLESGIATYLITVKTKNKQIKVGYSNVELI